jgi:hypothetical protein
MTPNTTDFPDHVFYAEHDDDFPDIQAVVLDIVESDRSITSKVLHIAALCETGSATLPKGSALEELAASIGMSKGTAYRALGAEDGNAHRLEQLHTTLYRWFDTADVLLYVGISAAPAGRAETHERESAWMQFAAWSAVEALPTRSRALKAESAAIAREKPVFNIQGNDTPAARQRRDDYLTSHG